MPRSSNSAKFFASKNPASSRTMIGGIIAGPDQAHDAPDHLLHIAAVVAVPLATPENGIDDLAFPNQMQGLESLDLFIGRVAPFPLQGLIVIHDHGVQRQHHHPHFLPPQAPEKQLLQHPAEGSGMENVSGGERLGHFGGPFWATPFPLARGSQNGPRST